MTLEEKHAECLEAMREFVARCDQGFARSTITYARFKEIIARHEGATVVDTGAEAEAQADQWRGSSPDLAADRGAAQPDGDAPSAAV